MASTGFSSRPDHKSNQKSEGQGFSPKEIAEQDQLQAAQKHAAARQSSGTSGHIARQTQGGGSLSPREQAQFDQIEAGLRDEAPEPEAAAEAATAPTPDAPSTPSSTAPTKPNHAPTIQNRSQKSGAATDRAGGKTAAGGAAAGGATALGGGTSGSDGLTGGLAGGGGGGLSNFSARARSLFSGKRRGYALVGGIVGILLSLVIGFFTFLPLKLETMMKSIETHEMARVNNYVTRRMDAIVFRYLYEKVTGTLAADGFYTGPGPLKTLWGNMEVNKFEDKLADKGIKLSKTGPHSLKISYNGTDTPINSLSEMSNFFESDLRGPAARHAINTLVDDIYSHPLQFFKRRHLRKYVKNAYNIRKWSVKKQEEVKDPAHPDLPGPTMLEVQDETISPAEDLTISSVDCLVGAAPCPEADARHNPDGTSKFSPTKIDPNANGTEKLAADETKTGIRDQYKAFKEAAAKTTADILTKAFGPAITKALFKAVPIVGWLSLAAELDNFFYTGTLHDIGVALHSAQYAAAALKWSSLADQAKAGELTASQVNVLSASLDNMEQSNAVQRVFFGSPDLGAKLPDDKKVGSANLNTADDGAQPCSYNWGVLHLTDPGTNQEPWTFIYRKIVSFPATTIHVPLCVLRGALNTLSQFIQFLFGDTLSKIFQAFLDGINGAASAISCSMPGGCVNVNVMDGAKAALSWMMDTVWKPVLTGRETGSDLGNAIDAGWDVTANQSCRDVLGCHNIATPVAFAQKAQLDAEQSADLHSQGVLASLFSTDSPRTLGSQLLAMMPASPGSAVTSISSYTAAIFSHPERMLASIITRSSSSTVAAAPVEEPNGVQQTGYTANEMASSDINTPKADIAGPPNADGTPSTTPDGHIDQYDCPVITDPNQPNICLIDTAAAQILCAGTTTNDDGGLGGNGTPGDCGDSSSPTAAATPASVIANQAAPTANPFFSFWNLFGWLHS